MPNYNPVTGIAYGYIAANALGEVAYDLLYGDQATDETMAEAEADYRAENGLSDDDDIPQEWYDEYECDEPIVSGVLEGVTYRSSWLGGALNFFILHSPHVTDRARRASPCVPGAGILDTLDGEETSYDVPASWRFDTEGN